MRAAALAAAYAQGGGAPAVPAVPVAAAAQQQRPAGFESEIEINDFPQNARWKVTHKGFQQDITDMTGAAVTTKGIYVAPGV
jgi:ATP-dependent RNA helicase DDX46/PRP5